MAWRGGERADRERGQGASEGMGSSGIHLGERRGTGTHGVERESHGGASSAWLPRAPPLRSFPEHLAGDDVATLEPSFGHLRGIFGSRRLKQSG